MIITAEQFRVGIAEVYPRVEFPKVPRSLNVFIPHVEFFKGQWRSFWADYCRSRGLTGFNKDMCDLFAAAAAVEFGWMSNKEAARQNWGEIAGGLVEARVNITGTSLNGVTGGSHATDIVGLTEDGKEWKPYFWEPQIHEPIQLTTLAQARDNWVAVYCVLD